PDLGHDSLWGDDVPLGINLSDRHVLWPRIRVARLAVAYADVVNDRLGREGRVRVRVAGDAATDGDVEQQVKRLVEGGGPGSRRTHGDSGGGGGPGAVRFFFRRGGRGMAPSGAGRHQARDPA